jgi:hypothetical protein
LTLNLLEEPIHHAQVIVEVRIEAGAEAMQEGQAPRPLQEKGTRKS